MTWLEQKLKSPREVMLVVIKIGFDALVHSSTRNHDWCGSQEWGKDYSLALSLFIFFLSFSRSLSLHLFLSTYLSRPFTIGWKGKKRKKRLTWTLPFRSFVTNSRFIHNDCLEEKYEEDESKLWLLCMGSWTIEKSNLNFLTQKKNGEKSLWMEGCLTLSLPSSLPISLRLLRQCGHKRGGRAWI